MSKMRRETKANVCARLMAVALALLLCFGLLPAPARAETDGMLRVRLTRLGAPSELVMTADCDYYLASDPSVRLEAGAELTVTASEGRLTLSAGGKSGTGSGSVRLMRAESGSHGMRFITPSLSGVFCGDLMFTATGDVISTMLNIYVEDYLRGVIGYEMAPSSGLEALKAQAVAARNLALRQKVTRRDSDYDIADSWELMTYKGLSAAEEYRDAIAAVDETRGLVLYCGDTPATSYFCESNGGQTESSANCLGTALPYITVKDDPYDLASAGAKKTASIRRDGQNLAKPLKSALIAGMAQQLQQLGYRTDTQSVHVKSIRSVTPTNPLYAEPSRLFRELTFEISLTATTAEGVTRDIALAVDIPTYGAFEDWYDLSLNNGDNETVWVDETDRTFEISFRRSGTGMGLSQRGAQVMARDYGMSFTEILEFYYPGTELRQLTLADTAAEAADPVSAPDSDPFATARLTESTGLCESADDGADVLMALPAGATVDVYAVRGEWAAVGSNGHYGFVRTGMLASFTLTGASVTRAPEGATVQVISQAELLELPVDTAQSVGKLVRQQNLTLYAYTEDWAMVGTSSGQKGFIRTSLLTLGGDKAEAADDQSGATMAADNLYGQLKEASGLFVNSDDSVTPPQTLAQGTIVKLIAYNRSWAYVRTTDGAEGYVRLDRLQAVETAPAEAAASDDSVRVEGTRYVYVTEDLPMYQEVSESAEPLLTLHRGDQVQLGAYNSEWACVRAEGQTGFVRLTGLSDQMPASTQIPDEPEGGKVKKVKGTKYAYSLRDGACVYATWSTESQVLFRVEEGDRVQLGAYNSVWACVRLNGITGYMLVEDIRSSAMR